MPRTTLSRLLPLSLALFAAACSDSGEDITGEGSIQALHAMIDIGSVSFLIEETELSSLNYKESSGVSEFDDLEYEFSFEVFLPDDDEATVLVSTTLSVNRETDYLFALAGTFADPELVLWEQFGRDWDDELEEADDNDTEVTVMEVSFGSLWKSDQAVDVYFEEPGTSPLSATPIATLGYTNLQTAIELTADEYQLVLTPPGDPETILFASDPLSVFAATSNLFVVMDDGGETAADFTVRWIGTSLGTELFDINLEPEVSVVHAALGTDAIDVLSGGTDDAPLATDLPFQSVSAPVAVEDGVLNVNVTPAANPGVFLAEQAFSLASGSINRLYFVGPPGFNNVVLLRLNERVLATHARLQLFQAASRFSTVDIYLVDTDVDIALIGPNFGSIIYGTGTSMLDFDPGDYNLVVTEPGTKTIVSGPTPLSLEAGSRTGIVLLDSANLNAVDILLIDEAEVSASGE